MRKLKVVVASGATTEKVDDVRVLTNISSGKLGAMLADKFISNGHNVTYIAPAGAVEPRETAYNRWQVSNVETVMSAMQLIVPQSDVVIMPLAVSDFTFDYKGAVKCSSGSSEAFINHMRDTIAPTPKVIANFRAWNPKAILVGFKFTSGKSSSELHAIAMTLKVNNKLDMVFANDKKAMERSGSHNGTLIMDDWEDECHSKDEIATSIFENVIRLAGSRFK